MRKLFLLALTAIMLFGLSTFGQEKYVLANIPFDFMAAKKHMPAGTYELRVTDDTRQVQLVNRTTKDEATVEVMTRLAEHPTHKESMLTFDYVGETYFLEAYWPELDDGYLLHATPGKHIHKVITVEQGK